MAAKSDLDPECYSLGGFKHFVDVIDIMVLVLSIFVGK